LVSEVNSKRKKNRKMVGGGRWGKRMGKFSFFSSLFGALQGWNQNINTCGKKDTEYKKELQRSEGREQQICLPS
jgi:hypothetical protein